MKTNIRFLSYVIRTNTRCINMHGPKILKFFITSRSFLLRMRNVADESCGANQNTHFVFSNSFIFLKSCRLWDNVEKYRRAEQATDDNMYLHAGYLRLQTHTLRLCTTHCFPAATVVARTRLNVRLYVHWRSLLVWIWPCIVVNMQK